MKFQHLIEINAADNPREHLSREQLWQGLVLRAEAPTLFMAHLDSCTILERSANGLLRELQYGALLIRDYVRFIALEEVVYEVPAQGEVGASRMTMRIEEPVPQAFFVRFDYDVGTAETSDSVNSADPMNDLYDEYRRSAYYEADLETIRTIRGLAQAGRFDRLPS